MSRTTLPTLPLLLSALLLSACDPGNLSGLLTPAGPDVSNRPAPAVSASAAASAGVSAPGGLRIAVDLLDQTSLVRPVKADRIAEVRVEGKVLAPGSDYKVEDGLITTTRPFNGQIEIRLKDSDIPIQVAAAADKPLRLRAQIRVNAEARVSSFESGVDAGNGIDTTQPFLRGGKALIQVLDPASRRSQIYVAAQGSARLKSFQSGLPVFESRQQTTVSLRSSTLIKAGPLVKASASTLVLAPVLLVASNLPIVGATSTATPSPTPTPAQATCGSFPFQPDGSIYFGYEIVFLPAPPAPFVPVPFPIAGLQPGTFPSVDGCAGPFCRLTAQTFELRPDGSVALRTTTFGYTVNGPDVLPAGTIIYPTPCDFEAIGNQAGDVFSGLPTPAPLPTPSPPPPVNLPNPF